MIPRPRVAVVSHDGAALADGLTRLAPRVDLHRFRDLVGDAPALCRLRAEVVIVEREEFGEETVGALRMLRALLPDVRLVLVGPLLREVAMNAVAARLDASVVTLPLDLGLLSAAVLGAVHGVGPRTARMLLDLTRGLADEINNSLQQIGGYLRLLEDGLDRERDRDRLDQIRLIEAGVARIDATIAGIGVLARAREAMSATGQVDLARLASDVAADLTPDLPVSVPADAAVTAHGSAELLRALLTHLVRAGQALRQPGAPARLEVAAADHTARVRLLIDGGALPDWRLPRTYEPYYLSRVFPGAPHGLSLSIVQLLAQSHGGMATARWTRDGSLCLEIALG